MDIPVCRHLFPPSSTMPEQCFWLPFTSCLFLVLMRFLTSVPFLSSHPSPCPSFSPIPTYSHAFRLRLRPVITTHPRLTSSNLCLFPYCFSPHSCFNLGYNLLQFLIFFHKIAERRFGILAYIYTRRDMVQEIGCQAFALGERKSCIFIWVFVLALKSCFMMSTHILDFRSECYLPFS